MSLPTTIPVSITELVQLLAQRLGISLGGSDYWVNEELSYHVKNAIREFQVLTGYWQQRLTLKTISGLPFYDLHTLAAGAIQRTVTDVDVLKQVCYHLLEYNGASTNLVNTGQFGISAIGAALGEQADLILGETRLVVTDFEGASIPPPPQGRLLLNPAVIQVHRADWYDTTSKLWTNLDRSDEIGGYGWLPGWPSNPSLPQAFAQGTTPPLQLQLIPAPINQGMLSLLVTASQGYSYSAITPVTLQLPDDSTWALTWGVLAAVLRQDAQSRDYARADYAMNRLHSALGVLKSFPCLLQAWPQGDQVMPSSLFSLDNWMPGWRNQKPGFPQIFAVGGRNMLALSPTPDAVYNIPIDCIGNSPASGSSSASFPIANDIVTGLLNNAQHAACFKLAGPEFEGTMGLYRAFLEVAEAYASRERAQAINWENLRGVTRLENSQVPYETVEQEA